MGRAILLCLVTFASGCVWSAIEPGNTGDGDGHWPWSVDAACEADACRAGGSCIQRPSNNTCKCSDETVLPDCPHLAFRALPIPDNASECWPRGMSGDGSKVVGNCMDADGKYSSFMVWSDVTTSAPIKFGRSRNAMAQAASFDGSVVVGVDERGAVRVEGSSVQPYGSSVTSLHLVSDDGAIVGGIASTSAGKRGFIAHSPEQVTVLPVLSGTVDSYAEDLSADGRVVVGASGSDENAALYRPTRWSAELGLQALPSPTGLKAVAAQFVDARGDVIVGYGSDANDMLHVLRWVGSEVTEVAELAGKLPCALSQDGTTIAYIGGSGLGVFDDQHGDRDVRELLEASGVDLSGWELNSIYGASADAHMLVVAANHRAGDGRPRPVVIALDEPKR